LFVAIKGYEFDGNEFIEEAISNGAIAIVAQNEYEKKVEEILKNSNKEVIVIYVENSRIALAQIAACFYDFPARKLKLIGVTGTKGKTTTTYMIKSILASASEYIERAVPEISALSDEFYRGPEQGTWAKLQQLIEGIQWINSGAGAVANYSKSFSSLYEYIKVTVGMGEKLAELVEAVKSSDMVLISDLLNYEVIPMLGSIRDTADDIVNSGVGKDESN
jgi:hypothetical protein